jgi:ribosomal protein S11
LKHVETNFFIIITDLKGRVIKYVTSGRVSFSKNVRKKLSYYLVFPMMYRVLDKLKELKIKYVRFHIRNRGGSHVRKVKEFLTRKKFIIDQ